MNGGGVWLFVGVSFYVDFYDMKGVVVCGMLSVWELS